MTDKSTRWAFTAYEDQWHLFTGTMPELIAEWGWQTELTPTTGKKHYQGFLRTHRQVRFPQIRQVLPDVHLEISRNWSALLNYCKKEDTRDISGMQVHEISKNKPLTMAGALTLLAAYIPNGEFIMQYIKDNKKMITPKDEYWHCVREYIKDTQNYESIGLFSNPQMQNAWLNTKQLWIDRQTDRPEREITPAENIIQEYNDSPSQAFHPPPPSPQCPQGQDGE